MKLKANCGEDVNCGCKDKAPRGTAKERAFHHVKTHLSSASIRREKYEGRAYAIVPVVMARAGVVMNGSLTVESELIPESWNGVPVTIGHPEGEDGGFLSANTPEVLSAWHVGRIFNAVIDDGALKGEAWLEIERLNKIAPGLLATLEANGAMDVSTGYFCMEEEITGQSNGRDFATIARDIKPDHLALLPNEDGACSWKDGCGVRFNSQRRELMKLKDKVAGAVMAALGLKGNADKDKVGKAVEKALKTNERGADDDSRQIIADLISNDDSPFKPDDEDSLKMMSADTLKRMRENYLVKTSEEVEEEIIEEEPAEVENEEESDEDKTEEAANEEGEDEEDKKVAANRRAPKYNTKQVDAIVQRRVKEEVAKLLTNDDRVALARAKKSAVEHKNKLVAEIVGNSAMKKKEVEKMDLATLEVVANGLLPKANYGGIALPEFNEDDTEAEGMLPPSTREVFANRRKAKEAR